MLETPLQLIFLPGVLGVMVELYALIVRSVSMQRLCYVSVIVLSTFPAVALVGYDPGLASMLVALITIFRVINAMKLIQARMVYDRLRHSTSRTSLVLIGMTLLGVLIWFMSVYMYKETSLLLHLALVISLAGSVVLLLSARRTLARTGQRASDAYTPDTELPTVSICIAARNETLDLPDCLESAVKLDYPKLEILVLDDCSRDRTPEIIKGFARDGVRFVSGDTPQKGWLAKNQAYQTLAEAASGEILLFCGVDVRFERSALRAMVSSMSARKKQMLSILPHGVQAEHHASLLQPIRYWWEFALPRRLFRRPPVLSTVWVITRQAFFGRGAMKAVKNSVIPEGYFARELSRTDEYSFMRSSGSLGLLSTKQLAGQWQTAIRTRYPQLRQRPEHVLLLLLAEMWLLLLPVGLFILGFFTLLGTVWLLAGLTTIILTTIHYYIARAWRSDHLPLMIALFPAAVVMDIVVTLVSMWQYEFATVTWKDRNICIPVMQAIPKLPKLPE